MRWARDDGYQIDTDRDRLDRDAIHAFLFTAYWCNGIPREVMERSIEHSMCFGIYDRSDRQVGFARVITDEATFAWVADVFVLPDYRRRRLGVWLMETIAAHPDLQGMRRWLLGTRDAHDLYRKTGYVPLTGFGTVERYMIRPSEASYGRDGGPSESAQPDQPNRHGGQ